MSRTTSASDLHRETCGRDGSPCPTGEHGWCPGCRGEVPVQAPAAQHDAGCPAVDHDYRAITLWRPWAQLVALGVKLVENRAKLHTSWRGPLFIHAGQRWDEDGARMGRWHGHRIREQNAETGYLALATLADVHHADDDVACRCDLEWAEDGVWHWCLTDIRPFNRAVPLPGRQGLFKPDPFVVEVLDSLLTTSPESR